MLRRTYPALAAVAIAAVAFLATQLYASQKPTQQKQSDLIKPHELVKTLSGKSKNKPLVLQVGFQFLYENGHIDGAKWAGPASRPDGIRRLRETLKNVPKNRYIVIYCGCCPWSECPNVRPAYTLMKEMGYTDVKMLYIPVNFDRDWIKKGYPIIKGSKPGPR